MSTSEREIRLRPEFGALYGGIPPEVWLPAREVAGILVRRASTARQRVDQRTLDPVHFEFRGGAPARRSAGAQTRSTDRRPGRLRG